MKQIFKERFNRARMLFSLFIFLLRGYGCEESEVSEKSEIVGFNGMEFRTCAKFSGWKERRNRLFSRVFLFLARYLSHRLIQNDDLCIEFRVF